MIVRRPRRKVKYDVGYKIGKLTLVEIVEERNGVRWWRCRCSCGQDRIMNNTRFHRNHDTHFMCDACSKLERKSGHRDKYPFEYDARVALLWSKDNLVYKQIAKKLGITISQVHAALARTARDPAIDVELQAMNRETLLAAVMKLTPMDRLKVFLKAG